MIQNLEMGRITWIYLSGLSRIINALMRGRQECQGWRWKILLMDLKVGEGTMSQGKQTASRSQKRQENRFFLRRLQKESSSANTFILAFKTHFRPLASRIIK
jgi:hypothetical protein